MTNACEPGAGEEALARNGMTGERLLRMCRAIAHGYCHRTGAGLDTRIDDLVQHLALTATRRACNYDPAKNPNSTFSSWLWDSLDPGACIDWFRKKSEGFGDRRYGHDNLVILAGETIEQHGAPELDEHDGGVGWRWRYSAWLVQQPFQDWDNVNERRVLRWLRAAMYEGYNLGEFIAVAADQRAKAKEIEQQQAAA